MRHNISPRSSRLISDETRGIFLYLFDKYFYKYYIDKYNYICYYIYMRRKQYEKLLIKGSTQDT